jgi:hypothetical protein
MQHQSKVKEWTVQEQENAAPSKSMVFTATVWPVCASNARYTDP